MGWTQDDTKVRADLFKAGGKWMYTVELDYDGGDWYSWQLWNEARAALKRATERGTSGVTFATIPADWTMVVLEPHGQHGHPITVTADEESE